MDSEEEATQPCTQPLGSAIQKHIYDTTGVLCVLFPTTRSARATVQRLLHLNRDLVFVQHAIPAFAPNISSVTTSDEQLEDPEPQQTQAAEALSIALRFNPGPIKVENGFCFGRSPNHCDIILGDNETTRRVSKVHFNIFVNEQHVLMLEDHSTNGTWVDGTFLGPVGHNNHGPKSPSEQPQSRSLCNGTEIYLLKGTKEQEIRFMVRIPKMDGSGFEGDGDDFSSFDPNNTIHTAGPTAYLNHILKHRQGKAPTEGNGTYLPQHGPLVVAQPSYKRWIGTPKFQMLDIIGVGSFGTVQKAVRRRNGEEVAIKILNRRTFAKNNVDRTISYRKEVEILEHLKHPNIVQYHECFEDESRIYIVMEYVRCGDLGGYVNKKGKMAEPMVQEVTRQILEGIAYVHGKGISHRDIKPDNILLVSEAPIQVKISDFGLAKMVRDEETFLRTFCGTMSYLAPEVFPRFHMITFPVAAGSKRKRDLVEGKPKREVIYNQAVDIWSIGVVIFNLLTGKLPFESKHADEFFETIIGGEFDLDALHNAGVQNRHCIDFLSKLLEVNPDLRVNEHEALRHPWLAKSDLESVFSSSMEIDDELAMLYQQATQQQPGNLEDDGSGSWQEVVPESEDEEENFHRKKYDSFESSEDETGPPGDKQLKDRVYFDSDGQGEAESFDYAAHETEGILRSNTATICAFGQTAQQDYDLPFQEYGSEASIRTVTPHTIQVLSSQLSDLRDLGSQREENDAKVDMSSIQATSQAVRQLAPNLEALSPVMPPHSQFHSSNQEALHETDSIATTTLLDPQSNPTSPRNVFSQSVTDTVTSHNLMDTRILQSPNISITTHEECRPGMSSPLQSQSALAPKPQQGPIEVRAAQEGILDFCNRGRRIRAPYWGKLVPLADSIAHPEVFCRGDVVIFGRNPKCTLIYKDERLSRRHCVLKATPPSPAPEGAPPSRPTIWCRSGATNSIKVAGVDLSYGRHMEIHGGDEIVLFNDKQLNQKLAFMFLRPRDPARGSQGGDESTEAEVSSPSDSDTGMSG